MSRWLDVAVEGWPVILLLALLAAALFHFIPSLVVLPAFALPLLAAWKFHDPDISVETAPGGVISPVSGRVRAISHHGDELRILLQLQPFGPYFLRAPVEGKVSESKREHRGHGLSIQTDAGADIYLRLYGPALLSPRSPLSYGSRIGQGQRCGVLRLAAAVELVLPPHSELAVAEGDRVLAARSLLATTPGTPLPSGSDA